MLNALINRNQHIKYIFCLFQKLSIPNASPSHFSYRCNDKVRESLFQLPGYVFVQ